MKGDGTAGGQNSQIVSRTHLSVAFTTTTAQVVGSTDAANYSSVSVHITSQGTSSSVAFQASNDNSNWVNVGLMISIAAGASAPALSTISIGMYSGSVNYRYFRLNVTGISAGTTAGVIEFFTSSYASNTSLININSNSATGSAVPANAFYSAFQATTGNLTGFSAMGSIGDSSQNGGIATGQILYNGTSWDRVRSASTAAATTGTGLLGAGVLGIYNSSPPTITSGNYERLQLDSSGNLKVNIATGASTSTQITDGTNVANVLKGDGTAAGENAQFVAGSYKELASLTAGSLNAD